MTRKSLFGLITAAAGVSAAAAGTLAVKAHAPAGSVPAVATLTPSPVAGQSALVSPGSNGKLVYKPYDTGGDTIPDFSMCGYGGGGVPLPVAPVKITLTPEPGTADDLPRLQAAVDKLAQMPPGSNGLRGALLLKKGAYHLSDSLHIRTSGIVIRGEGKTPETGTVLIATGTGAKPVIEVRGTSGPTPRGSALKITDSYVPVGAKSLTVADGSGLHVGDPVLVRRVGNADWIHFLSMDQIVPRKSDPSGTKQWSPFVLEFDRVITAVKGNTITLDAPLTCAIDTRWGGGDVQPVTDSGRIEKVGVENLYAESVFDKSKTSTVGAEDHRPYLADEAHATYIVAFVNVRNAWARDLSARYLAQGVAQMDRGAKWITVQDCSSVDPISIITGGRRYTYNISGQLCLVQRCYARDARHAFIVAGAHVCGPNVFLDCKADDNHATSEPHQRWSVGGLYDNVNAPMAFQDRQWMGSGHGWAGANYVVWNSKGSVVCEQPPTAQNFCIGFVGTKSKGAFPRPDGWWESFGKPVAPRSLYQKQLEDRLGKQAVTASAAP